MSTSPSKHILITKASGERESFSAAKLQRSLERAHASPEAIAEVVASVTDELREGMTTADIYLKAFSLLKKYKRPVAAKYSLKKAIMELGPTGRPFEQFVAALLACEGFTVTGPQVVRGVCVKHEIDASGMKDNRHIMVECKFHNLPGTRSDVKIVLYVQARFEDVERQWQKQPEHGTKFHEAWLVTNTKLTSDAVDYAECVGMTAIGWNYPFNNGLEVRIERAGLHPITCLTTLTRSQKIELLNKHIVLCKELIEHEEMLSSIGVRAPIVQKVLDEANALCKNH